MASERARLVSPEQPAWQARQPPGQRGRPVSAALELQEELLGVRRRP